MRHRYLILPIASLLLLSCGELVEDTGIACVVPQQPTCVCDEYVEEGSVEPACFPPLYADCSGEFVAGLAHEVEVWLGPGHGDSWDIECEARITGDHELTISASFKWKRDQEHDIEPDILVSCETPPLSEGEWDVRYGDNVSRLTVGSGETDSAICVDSGRDR